MSEMANMQYLATNKFERDNVSKFLKEYEANMRFMGRGEAAQLVDSLACFVDEEVLDALEAEDAFVQRNWDGVKTFLKNRYKRYDGSIVTRHTIETEIKRRDYTDLQAYVRNFERLTRKLVGVDALTPGEKVRLFLQGLKTDDSKELGRMLVDEATGTFTHNWGNVMRAVNLYVIQKEAIASIENEGEFTVKPDLRRGRDESNRGRQGLKTLDKANPLEALTKQFEDLKIQHLQLQKDFERQHQQHVTATVTAERNGANDQQGMRCLYCDAPGHNKRNCERLTDHIRNHKVRLNERQRVCDAETGEEYRPNVGRGGIIALVEEKERHQRGNAEERGVPVRQSYGVTLVDANSEKRAKTCDLVEPKTHGELKKAADNIREKTGWDCPVETASLRAYYDVDVEGKRVRNEEDVGRKSSLRRVRVDPGEGSSSGSPNLHRDTTPSNETTEEERRIAPVRQTRSTTENRQENEPTTTRNEPKGKEPERNIRNENRNMENEEDSPMRPGQDRQRQDVIRYQRKSEVELGVNPEEFVMRAILEAQTTLPVKDMLAVVNPSILRLFKSKITKRNVPVGAAEVAAGQVDFEDEFEGAWRKESLEERDYKRNYYAKGALTANVRVGSYTLTALLDGGSEVNLMPYATCQELGLKLDTNITWGVRNADTRSTRLKGVCHEVPVEIGGIVEKCHVFVTEACGYDLILGRPWEAALRAAYRNLDDGSCWAKVYSRDGRRAIQLMVTPTDHPHNRDKVRDSDF